MAGNGDWEAFSAAYQAMQSLSPSSDKIPYFTGSASAALATLTSFARSILDDTSAEAVRNTIAANAATCGGIVAQSLTPNGYVKWANGFIIQWGKDYLSSSGQEFIAPLATTHMWGIFVMDVDYGCDRFGAETTAGNKFMVWNKSDSGNFTETNFRWFAICG